MRHYEQVAQFRTTQALDDLELVHAGPTQAFHLIGAAGRRPALTGWQRCAARFRALPLVADTPHSLAAPGERWPVIEGIPFLRANRAELASARARAAGRGAGGGGAGAAAGGPGRLGAHAAALGGRPAGVGARRGRGLVPRGDGAAGVRAGRHVFRASLVGPDIPVRAGLGGGALAGAGQRVRAGVRRRALSAGVRAGVPGRVGRRHRVRQAVAGAAVRGARRRG